LDTPSTPDQSNGARFLVRSAPPGLPLAWVAIFERGRCSPRLSCLFSFHRGDKPLDEPVHRLAVYPSHYRYQVVVAIDIDHVGAVSVVNDRAGRLTVEVSTVVYETQVPDAVGRM